MILSDLARIIDGAPPDLQTAKIVDERLLTIRELGVLFSMSETKLRRLAAGAVAIGVGIGDLQRVEIIGSCGEVKEDRKSTRLNSSHQCLSRMPSSA